MIITEKYQKLNYRKLTQTQTLTATLTDFMRFRVRGLGFTVWVTVRFMDMVRVWVKISFR